MNFMKYQKLKAMQSFRQKFSLMTKEYRSGFWDDMNRLSEKLNNQGKENEKIRVYG